MPRYSPNLNESGSALRWRGVESLDRMQSPRMSRCSIASPIGVAIALALVSSGCAPRLLEREVHDRSEAAKIDHDEGYLKAHMLDGALCVLSQWDVDESRWQLTGSGVRYDANRDTSGVGNLVVSIDSVALFETNSAPISPAIGPMLLMTVASGAMTAYCAGPPEGVLRIVPDVLRGERRG